MDINEFVTARLDESDVKLNALYMVVGSGSVSRELASFIDFARSVVELHKNWPVMVTSPTSPVVSVAEGSDFHNSLSYKVAQTIEFRTQEEYRKNFGYEPPTAPIMASLASCWKRHPDYQSSWAWNGI